MKNLAIIIPPRRLNAATLSSCMRIWREELKLSVYSVGPCLEATASGETSSIEQLSALDSHCFDAVAVMDGNGSIDLLGENADVIATLQTFDAARKLISGIGLGNLALARAGLLLGKKAATKDADYLHPRLKGFGVIFVPEDVVALKWIITGSGADVDTFAIAVNEWLRDPPEH
ncbi:DJ-1/PfpI family protein [Pseudomonas sp. DC3000-4b1]|uniref:DJ-1/PfpI family protein n=1 Tax=unclassified Pseudomonas TaxID=196821 RepID=UPI003CF42BEF